MPELPEVETVRLGLAPVLVGNSFASVEQRRGDLRFPLPKHFAAAAYRGERSMRSTGAPNICSRGSMTARCW